MKCEKSIELMDAAVHAELDAAKSVLLNAHLKDCPECTRIYSELKGFCDEIQAEFPTQEPPSGLRGRVNAAIADELAPKRSMRRMLMPVSAAAAAIFILFIGIGALSPKLASYSSADENMYVSDYDAYEKESQAAGGMSNASSAPREAMEERGEVEADDAAAYPPGENVLLGTAANQASASREQGAERKLIQNASVSMETSTFDGVLESIESGVTEAGGYLQNLDVWGVPLDEEALSSASKQYGRTANLVARIPAEKLEAFLAKSENLAQVTARSKNTNDVTTSYRDVQTRLNTLNTQHERLTELLKKADNMTDIIALESELQRVQYEIEWQTQQLRGWDDLVDYSTVNISLTEVYSPDKVRPIAPSLGERISREFIANINATIDAAQNFIVWLTVNSPIIVVVIIAVVLTAIAVRKRIRNKKL